MKSDKIYQKLLQVAVQAMDHSYAPYSGYRVGAAVLCSGHQVFSGCNIENASYGLTVCAERIAIFNAVSHGHQDILAIAVTIDDNNQIAVPCGACRQVMSEFMSPDSIIITSNNNGKSKYRILSDFYPIPFDLKNNHT